MRNVSHPPGHTHSHQTQPACHNAFTWLSPHGSVHLTSYLFSVLLSHLFPSTIITVSQSNYNISMAVHADYPGLTVEIYVDGRPLKEYQHEEEEDTPKVATRYVECRSGAEFSIKTKFKAPFKPMDTSIVAYLDGTRVHSQAAQPHEMLTRVYNQRQHEWKENGGWRASNFLFSSLDFGIQVPITSCIGAFTCGDAETDTSKWKIAKEPPAKRISARWESYPSHLQRF